MKFLNAIIVQVVIIVLGTGIFSCKKEPTEKSADEGIISFYEFRNNAKDPINNVDGIETNVSYITINYRIDNLVLLLSGKNSFLKIPDPFDYEARTVSLWFYVIEAYDNLSVIYSSDNPGLKYGLTLLNIQRKDSHINLYFNVSNYQDTVQITDHRWYHAAITTNGEAYFYYLDGSLIKSGIINSYISSSQGVSATLLGCDRYMNKRFFHGLIDNLRIYSRELTAAEINDLSREIIY